MKPRKVPKELDQAVDIVFSHNPKQESRASLPSTITAESWATSINAVFDSKELRLDASHFHQSSVNTIRDLKQTGLKLQPLSDLAKIWFRGPFTRVWSSPEYGLPYFNATDLLSLLALGVPSGGPRYLSNKTKTNIQALIVSEGWLLMTCSGTIGRVFCVPKRLDGWVATHDLIRIIPHQTEMTGYLYAWLGTEEAQSQILSYTHGGQIDHVTDEQVSRILVPLPSHKRIRAIHAVTMKALSKREEALKSLSDAWEIDD
ncbi:MAG: hypothetical protein F4103_02005 [Boseongicola sp. SB0673_bin_14]|nr:hypothetical protein [Boseongicola sp. SB0673_bin_14]